MGFKMPDISMPHFSKFYFESSDFRQLYTVAKNETIKSVRGKRFLVSLAIIVLVYALITLIPIMLGQNVVDKGYGGWISSYLDYVTTFIALIAALIGAVAIVSEYEERTALILFTRPVKKTTIFVGKFISAYIVCVLMMMLYYLLVAITGLYYFNTVSTNFFESLAMCLIYVFAAIGIAFVFSGIFKRSAISIIATILTLIIVIPVIAMMITGDKSFMLNVAGGSTITCIPEYVANYNSSINDVSLYFDKVINNLTELLKTKTPGTAEYQSIYQSIVDTSTIKSIVMRFLPPISSPDLLRDAIVMFGWGFVSLVAAWLLFLRKQF